MRRVTKTRVGAGALAIALVLVGFVAGPAYADVSTFAISGNVTHAEDDTLFGDGEVVVEVYLSGQPAVVAQGTTDPAGHYSVPGLAPGTYQLFFDAASPHVQDVWLGSTSYRSSSPTVTITAADVTTNMELAPNGTVVGRVALGDGSTYASTGQVRVFYAPAVYVPGYIEPDLTRVASVGVDADGRFSISDLGTGGWVFRYVPQSGIPFGSSVWGGEQSISPQTWERSLSTVVLQPGGAISGHITVNGQPAHAGEVQLLIRDFSESFTPIGETDANGDYVTDPLPTGWYPVFVHYTGSGSFADEWFNFSADQYYERQAGVWFSPTLGVDYDANLQPGADLRGVLTDATGAPVAGAIVKMRAYYGQVSGGDAYGAWFETTSDSQGHYHLTGLPRGDYALSFVPTDTLFADQFYVERSLTTGQQKTENRTYYLKNEVDALVGCATCGSTSYDYYGRLERQTSSGSWAFVMNAPVTAGSSSFRFVRPGKYRVKFLSSSGHATLTSYSFSVANGQDVSIGPVGRLFSTTGSLSISGTARVGARISSSLSSFSPTASAVAYQWLRDGVPIPDANATSYIPTGDDIGHILRLRIAASRLGYSTKVITSSATATVTLGVLKTATPQISGTVRVGSTLTVLPGTWTPGATLTYQWRLNGVAVPDATNTTFTLTPADVGKTVTVKVTGTKEFYV